MLLLPPTVSAAAALAVACKYTSSPRLHDHLLWCNNVFDITTALAFTRCLVSQTAATERERKPPLHLPKVLHSVYLNTSLTRCRQTDRRYHRDSQQQMLQPEVNIATLQYST
jgi:hypothetical protein